MFKVDSVEFLCNGKDPKCKNENCEINGTGFCKYTTDIKYAANYEKYYKYLDGVEHISYREKYLSEGD